MFLDASWTVRVEYGEEIMNNSNAVEYEYKVDADLQSYDNTEKNIMKMKGMLVDLLLEISPDTYKDHVRYENN